MRRITLLSLALSLTLPYAAIAQTGDPIPRATFTDGSERSYRSVTGLVQLTPVPEIPLVELSVAFRGRTIRMLIQSADRDLAKAAADAVAIEADRVDRFARDKWELEELRKINEAAGQAPVTVSNEMFFLLKEAQKVARLTEGSFDLTDAPLQDLWGSGANIAPPDPKEAKRVLPLIDYRRFELKPDRHSAYLKKDGMRVGLKGLVKGYLLDRLREIMRRYGFESYAMGLDDLWMVHAPGDKPLWFLRVLDSRNQDEEILRVPLTKAAVSVVEGQGRDPGEVLLSPKTGYPPDEINTVVLMANYAHWAQALSQGIFVLGPKKSDPLLELLVEAEGLVVDRDGGVHVSKGFRRQMKTLLKMEKKAAKGRD